MISTANLALFSRILKKQHQQIALISIVILQGCSSPPIIFETKPPFSAEQAKKYRERITELDQQDRKIAHEERMRKAEADVKILNAQKPTTIIMQQPTK